MTDDSNKEKGLVGFVPCEMLGGPLDGAKYGDLPDSGKGFIGTLLTVPLSQPADQSAKAIYMCLSTAPVGGFWQFHYYQTVYPGLPIGTTVQLQKPSPATRS